MQPTRIEPGPGQESVWDYPRPPRLEPSQRHIVVVVGESVIADTRRSFRVLETSHPPVYYIPPEDVRLDRMRPGTSSSYCEWKGQAAYLSVRSGASEANDVAWYYPQPKARFAEIAGYIAFYPSRVDACFVDGEQVRAQPGDFYGGWITDEIVGPFKGDPGTMGW